MTDNPDKGLADGSCNRSACQAPLQAEPVHQFMDGIFTGGPRLHYCARCAADFDTWDKHSGDAVRIQREDKGWTVVANVSDRRHAWIGRWATGPLVLAELTEADVGRTVIYVDETKSFMRRAEAGTLSSVSHLTGTVFARFDTGDTAQACPVGRLCFGLRPLDGDLSRGERPDAS